MSSPDLWREGEEARPGLAPGSRGPQGTMFAALYGELEPHPWCDPATASGDAYSLFHTRSLAMGWLDDIGRRAGFRVNETTGQVEAQDLGEQGAAGLWGMNDAGPDHPGAGSPSPVGWFQVGVDAVPDERPMPVHPFLYCAGDVMARFGELRLQAVQVLLPVQCIDASSRRPGMVPPIDSDWFADGDPRSRTRVRVTVDSGQVPSVPSAAPAMHAWMRGLEQSTFVCDSYSLTHHDPMAGDLPFHDAFWQGPPLHQATFAGTLAEWSPDALGWLAAFLAEALARHGVTTPTVLTVGRTS